MSAATVEARPTAGKRAAVRSAAPATPLHETARTKSTFERIAAVLAEASNLDDLPHVYSGESDRLLRIAADLAFGAAEIPPREPECIAFDIAALIKASRLVPGDVENAQRRGLIEAAAVDLASLADCSGPASMMDPEADRPALKIRGREVPPEDEHARHLDAENALSDNFHWLGGLLATIMCMHDGDIEEPKLPSPAHRRALVRHAFAVATRAHAIATKVGTIRNRVDVLEELAFARAALAALHSSFEGGQGDDTFFGDNMVCGLVGAAANCLERARLWLNPPDEQPSPVTDRFFLEERRPMPVARPTSREAT